MRVYVYKAKDGKQDVLFRPARHRAEPMVLLQGLTRANRKEAIGTELQGYAERRALETEQIPF